MGGINSFFMILEMAKYFCLTFYISLILGSCQFVVEFVHLVVKTCTPKLSRLLPARLGSKLKSHFFCNCLATLSLSGCKTCKCFYSPCHSENAFIVPTGRTTSVQPIKILLVSENTVSTCILCVFKAHTYILRFFAACFREVSVQLQVYECLEGVLSFYLPVKCYESLQFC